ncbi:transposase [Cyclobacterium xiamenense]|uniref:transposase n=1 Tax=Cyclobacterium xiamenense TaxID=1297121 RepID=UPI0015A711DF
MIEKRIIRNLKLQEEGIKRKEIRRKHGINSCSFYAWWKKYAAMEVQVLRRLRSLEEENNRFKRIVVTKALRLTL